MLAHLTLTHDQLPDRLNGFPVIHAEICGHCVTVMVERRPNDFVVATWTPLCGSEWWHGNYFEGEDAFSRAAAAFDRIAAARR